MHHLTVSITDLGDSAVTLPLAAAAIAILLAAGRLRLAAAWAIAIAACVAATAALKLALAMSPSGHASVSAVVYGGFVVAVGPSLTPLLRWPARAGAGLLIAAIALSRLVLHKHTIEETIVGLALGLGALAAFRAVARDGRTPVLWMCAAAAVVIVAMHGTRWQAEALIRGLG